ncbi:cytosine deaminase [Diplodia corticola]|uniref:Cytosine deaminase n=1 Tax=Diplodia corticola TaxID=236234 RepID=A0A1J9RXY2_9PEZI|nr:cytosine deaminase [Diplodia corticola]OJD32325.1 cytosine deaminase [Diplodia corticola]
MPQPNEHNMTNSYRLDPADIELSNRKPEDPEKILFKNVIIIDSTGRDPYLGHVLIEGERISKVGDLEPSVEGESMLVIDGKGKKTLMSGLCDSHTHLSYPNAATLDQLTGLQPEEHVLHTAHSAKTYLDCGYTMCFGAASARPRLDLSVKGAIKTGMIPGPRTLANGQEIAKPSGALVPGITRYADGVDEMRKAVSELVALGVDNVKLSMSGDDITPDLPSEETYFTLEETRAAVEVAHAHGKRVCTHARSAASVKMCCEAGVDVIYHADFVDAEGLDMLEAQKDRVFVAPAMNLPLLTCTGEAAAFGFSAELAEKKGLLHQINACCKGMTEMRKRGIRVLPGGDFGFAWAPHGTYSRDLANFVNLFGYTPMEAIISATAWGGEIMGHAAELGKLRPGYYADVILVDGNPVEDISILQDTNRIHAIVINGHIHKHIDPPAERKYASMPVVTRSASGGYKVSRAGTEPGSSEAMNGLMDKMSLGTGAVVEVA